MALCCKVCDTELDVFAAGRCKQCRQLVCENCVASGESGSALVCTDCAAHAPPEPAPAPPPVADASASVDIQTPQSLKNKRLVLQTWALVAFAAILGAIFFTIFLFPYWESQQILQQIQYGTAEEAQQATTKLATMQSDIVLEKLKEIVETGVEPTRTRAIRALGVLPLPASHVYLRELTIRDDVPESVKIVATEAMIDHEQRYEVNF